MKLKKLFAGLYRAGWKLEREEGSHKILSKDGRRCTFAFHTGSEVGTKMVGKVARATGLSIDDL